MGKWQSSLRSGIYLLKHEIESLSHITHKNQSGLRTLEPKIRKYKRMLHNISIDNFLYDSESRENRCKTFRTHTSHLIAFFTQFPKYIPMCEF